MDQKLIHGSYFNQLYGVQSTDQFSFFGPRGCPTSVCELDNLGKLM